MYLSTCLSNSPSAEIELFEDGIAANFEELVRSTKISSFLRRKCSNFDDCLL